MAPRFSDCLGSRRRVVLFADSVVSRKDDFFCTLFVNLVVMKESRTLISDTLEHVGKEVTIHGWAQTVRDHGKVTFVDMRDRTGLVQCVISDRKEKFSPESVLELTGVVKERPKGSENTNLATGGVEIEVSSYEVLNQCKELPIPIDGDGYDLNEDMRLKYRFLDLRRERMRNMLKLRSSYVQALRNALLGKDFVEVETPLLTKGTSEGARNFIVPSRIQPGKFYALPQSPQQYKQLLMTGGVENYFQLARCIRDEDPKSDRVLEHTQLDIEMSFVDMEDVMVTVEDVVKTAVTQLGYVLKEDPFPVIKYEDALKKYGDDKFDLRTEEEKKNGVLAFAWVTNFPFFKKVNKADAAEVEDSRSGWVFTHNPFSKPIEEHLEWHLKGENIDKIITTQYDLVCNGFEFGGGSIRAHKPEVLQATYKIMGYSDEEIEEIVGHMLKAFELGTPPHGGIACGIERGLMCLTGEKSMGETIAFPTSGSGRISVTDAPSDVSPDLLKELGIRVESGDNDVVFVRLKRLLDGKGVKYTVLEHKPVKTSEEAAKVRGTDMSMAPKAMILKNDDGEFIMVCVPADSRVNLEKVSEVVGKKVNVTSAEEVEEQFGIKVGAVPPFGKLFGIEMYLDKDFWDKDEVVFNAGRRDRSIRMKAQDLIATSDPNKISKDSDFKK